ncbi:hypothetical protein ABZY58_29265 [Micromonospora tulbaghiae]|uniref:competence protein CoiA family protein n=1 Tax=Micromonospora tulbaghiae TaxID=479978 RepID=UPI0033A1226E
MANGVFYVPLGIELDLTRDDLGHPNRPDLWDRIYRQPYRDGVLQCLTCREASPDCPEWMFLRVRNGRREAVHHTTGLREHGAPESDAHKALKERIATAATTAGFEAIVEDSPRHRKRRTDVVVHGAVTLGCEAQLSYATAASVRKRTLIAVADGITPLWTTTDRKAQLIDQAPWARIDQMPWHQYTTDPLPVRGGVRSLVREQCHRLGTVCPDKKAGRRCSGWHGRWDVRQIPFDDLIARGAAGELVPYADRRGKRVAHWFWVPAADVVEVTDEDESQPEDQVADAEMQPHQRTFERICRYLEESDFRSTSTVRDVGEQLFATLANPPAQQLLAPPPISIAQPGVCTRGPGCTEKARLYPGGWGCDAHKP